MAGVSPALARLCFSFPVRRVPFVELGWHSLATALYLGNYSYFRARQSRVLARI